MKESKYIIIFFLICIFLFVNNESLSKIEVKSVIKVDDIHITNIDFYNEIRFQVLMNENLKSLNKNELNDIAQKNLINEKIKLIELKKYYDLDQNNQIIEKLIVDRFIFLGLNNIQDVESFLEKNNISFDFIKSKIIIEKLWQEFIVFKFKDRVNINKKKIEKKILNKNFQESYRLSEIFFQIKNTSDFLEITNEIYKDIKNLGFVSAVKKYSMSETNRNEGKLGWINKSQLPKNILNELDQIKLGQVTRPVRVEYGFLILKLEDKKKIKTDINIENELIKQIQIEENKQLNNFANMYFNKLLLKTNVKKN